MLINIPRLIPPQEVAMERPGTVSDRQTPQLAVWPVLGKSTEAAAYLGRGGLAYLPTSNPSTVL